MWVAALQQASAINLLGIWTSVMNCSCEHDYLHFVLAALKDLVLNAASL